MLYIVRGIFKSVGRRSRRRSHRPRCPSPGRPISYDELRRRVRQPAPCASSDSRLAISASRPCAVCRYRSAAAAVECPSRACTSAIVAPACAAITVPVCRRGGDPSLDSVARIVGHRRQRSALPRVQPCAAGDLRCAGVEREVRRGYFRW